MAERETGSYAEINNPMPGIVIGRRQCMKLNMQSRKNLKQYVWARLHNIVEQVMGPWAVTVGG
jgi:hypothetical protein